RSRRSWRAGTILFVSANPAQTGPDHLRRTAMTSPRMTLHNIAPPAQELSAAQAEEVQGGHTLQLCFYVPGWKHTSFGIPYPALVKKCIPIPHPHGRK